jgi:NitT/TauT family transport system substrate-binding protein
MLNEWQRVDAGFAEWIWKPRRASLTLDQSLVKTLESEARWAMREGHVKGSVAPNYLGFIHAAPLQALDPDAVGMAH